MSSFTDRFRENVTSAMALVVIGVAILAYAVGVSFWWAVLVLGLFVIVPLTGLLFGAPDWRKWDPLSDEFWEDIFGEEEEPAATEPSTDPPTDPLTTLRDRYARGELTDEQFERKLEQLLATETIEDVEDRRQAERARE